MKEICICFDDAIIGRAYAILVGEECPIGWEFGIVSIHSWPSNESLDESLWDPIVERNQDVIGGLTVEYVDRLMRT